MGKSGEQHHPLPSIVAAQDSRPNALPAGCAFSVVGLKCLIVLLFSLALFLSALFWLPPFVHFADPKDLLLNSKYKGGFLTSFQTNFFSLSRGYPSKFSTLILILGNF